MYYMYIYTYTHTFSYYAIYLFDKSNQKGRVSFVLKK